jgi:GR25 family glycosyltransferase involved in LPS biosynthesis
MAILDLNTGDEMMYIFFLSLVGWGWLNFFSANLEACIYPYETPVVKYLKPIEISEFESGLELVDCIYVINLDIRPEKWQRMKTLFEAQNIKINRMSGINGWEISEEVKRELVGNYPIRMLGGQFGCYLSHLSTVKDAYKRGFNIIWILEDDIEFTEDVNQIPYLLAKLSGIDPDWDVFYTDIDIKNRAGERIPSVTSDFRPDQEYYPLNCYTARTVIDKDIMKIGQRFGLHSVLISRKGIKKIIDYFTHVYLWTAVDIDIHYIPTIRQYSATRDIVANCISIPPISDTIIKPIELELTE